MATEDEYDTTLITGEETPAKANNATLIKAYLEDKKMDEEEKKKKLKAINGDVIVESTEQRERSG
jgi:hypothetical protein